MPCRGVSHKHGMPHSALAPTWTSSVTLNSKSVSQCARRKERKPYRSVVDQGHLHHGLELAILDPLLLVLAADLLDKVLVQPAGLLGVGCTMKVGLGSLLRLGEEREL